MQKEQIEPEQNISVTENKYFCQQCNLKCSKKCNYVRHIKTQKHQLKQENGPQIKDKYICKCGKIYKHNAGLWSHKKKCILHHHTQHQINSSNIDQTSIEKLTAIVLTVVTKQVETQQQLNDFITTISNPLHQQQQQQQQQQVPKILDQTSKKTFLSELCKEALNMNDFIKLIKYNIQDLEWVGKYGYVDGITRIIVNELKSLDILKRPIWCSDEKRESIYIKINNVWEKDTEDLILTKKMIFHISTKYYSSLIEWQLKYPGCKESNHPKNDEYLSMIYQSFGGKNGYEIETIKIIKNVLKYILIPKSMHTKYNMSKNN